MKAKDFLWSLLAIVMAATMSVGLQSCGDDDPDPEPVPELSISSPTSLSISFQANGDGEKTITVSASHTDWTASVTDGSSWLRVNKNGQLASVSVDSNPSTQTRNGKIKITATADARLSYDISVSQAGADGTITVSSSSFEFETEGGSQTVTVTSNSSWNASSSQGWLTVSPSSLSTPTASGTTSVTLTASENKTNNDRSCTVTFTTTDGKSSATVSITQKKQNPEITVNGSSSAELTFPGVFDNGKSGIDYKQVFKIKSNVQWTLSGKEDWLNVSPTSGNGEVDLTIYPSSANNTDKERKATLTLSGSNVSVTINITQEGGKPVCYVLPANEVALYDRIGWEYTGTSNVNKFQWILLSEREFNRMTDNELIEEISKEDELKFIDDYLTFVAYDSHDNRISQSSTYYLVTIAYDGDGKAGELKKTKIKTPAFLDVDNDAWVNFDNVACNFSQGFWFDAIKEGYCNTYHLIYGIQTDTYNSVVYAFEINYYLKNKKKHWFAENWEMEIVTDYPNNHTFTYSTNLLSYIPICFAYGWGVFKDGSISSDLVGFQWDTSKEEARRLNVRNADEFKNITYRRSVEMERAKRALQKRM